MKKEEVWLECLKVAGASAQASISASTPYLANKADDLCKEFEKRFSFDLPKDKTEFGPG